MTLALRTPVLAAGCASGGRKLPPQQLSAAAVRQLCAAAERRRIAPNTLAVRIIETVTRANLIDAVLDDAPGRAR